MINLLPDSDKKELRAARTNLLLFRYNLMLVGVAVFLGMAVGFTYYTLNAAQMNAQKIITDNIKKESDYAQVRTDAAAFSSQLAEAKTILDGQLSYSKAILIIAPLIPAGAALNELALDESTPGKPLILLVRVNGEDEAGKVRDNFKKSSYFSSVTTGRISTGVTGYPYTMELTVVMKKEAFR